MAEPGYDELAEDTRQLLIKRLTDKTAEAHRFAIVCLVALVKDGKIGELLFDPSTRAQEKK